MAEENNLTLLQHPRFEATREESDVENFLKMLDNQAERGIDEMGHTMARFYAMDQTHLRLDLVTVYRERPNRGKSKDYPMGIIFHFSNEGRFLGIERIYSTVT